MVLTGGLLIRSVIVVAVFAGLLTAVRMVGAINQPTAFDVIRAGRCTPMPCWQGIQPGKTRMEEAKTILAADKAVTIVSSPSYSGDICWYTAYGPFWRSCARQAWDPKDGDVVESINIEVPRDALRLGDMILLFGPPGETSTCSIANPAALTGQTNGPRRLIAVFASFEDYIGIMAVNTGTSQVRRLDPNMVVLRLTLHSTGWVPLTDARWRGFGRSTSRTDICGY
jgi:hypothetical protein